MRYYNEHKAERRIRRQALFITFFVFALVGSIGLVSFSESARDLFPDSIKEWFHQDAPNAPDQAQEKKA